MVIEDVHTKSITVVTSIDISVVVVVICITLDQQFSALDVEFLMVCAMVAIFSRRFQTALVLMLTYV